MGQEPGSAEEIQEFCSATYGVTFPMTEKIEVNGDERHEIYRALVETPNEKGEDGDVTWNFEKFLLDGSGAVVARFSPGVVPDDPAVVGAIEAQLS
jgi:glutathione peroxidase